MLWKLAVRHVVANRNRSILLTLSLALSSFVLVSGTSLVTSFLSNVERGLKRGLSGDLQVMHASNPAPRIVAEIPVDFAAIAEPASALQILSDDPDVARTTQRANVSALIVTESRTAPAVLVGIDPRAESETLELLLPDGEGSFEQSGGILLGQPMAERLDRSDSAAEVTVLIPTADGLFEGDVLEVAGIYTPPGLPLIDEFIAFMPFDHLQELLGSEGHPGLLVVRLRDGADLAATRERLRRAFRDAGLPLEAWSWKDVAGNLLGIAKIGQFLIGSGFLFVLAVIGLGVGNMLLILMLQRTREIGLMRALGTSKRRVIGALLLEVGLVSALASGAGAVVGAALLAVLGEIGIPATSRAMAYAFGGERFFPELRFTALLFSFLVVVVVGQLAALWPALRASSTHPGEVMRVPA